jgi:hypothetical protein
VKRKRRPVKAGKSWLARPKSSSAHLTLEKAVPGDPRHPRLMLSFEHRLA